MKTIRLTAMAMVLVILTGLLCGFTQTAAAEEPEVHTSGDYEYILLDDGTVEIKGYTGSGFIHDIVIPDQLDGYTTTSIGDLAFFYSGSLTSVTIPNSITSIGINPFYVCLSLTKIVVSPDHPTLAVINGVLFSKTDKRLVCYPSALTNSSYLIPQGIRIIGTYAFYGCDNLTSVTIPDSVTSINYEAFGLCSNLTSVFIPNSVTSIGINPFSSCKKLTRIIVSQDHPLLAVIDDVLFSKTDKWLICYPLALADPSYSIPQGTKMIWNSAFYDCDNLTSVTIPDSVTSIGYEAFAFCSNLISVTIPDSVTNIAERAFGSCPNLTITVTRGSYADQYCKGNGLTYMYSDSLDWLTN